ncbi:MAG: zf-HC2 domain-containing protein [Myxococcales bacterium]|nr:zf-HC2 domain-containing protein [Myxococcales bacterium]MCB9524679.1 zf-HC2 domain-containing protein [Myxococcales bacterium]
MSHLTCDEFHQFVDPYLDGEYDALERRDFDMHLAACGDCRRWFEQHRAIQSAVRQTLGRPTPMPGGAKARLRTRLALEAGPAQRRQKLVKLALPVPMVAAAAAVFFFVGTTGFTPTVVQDAVAQHDEEMPLDVPTPEAEELDQWFQRRARLKVTAPRFRDRRLMLMGGRLSRVGARAGHGQRAAYMVYGVGRHKVSVLAFDEDLEIEQLGEVRRIKGRPVSVAEHEGRRVVLFRKNGLTYTVTSDLSAQRMVELVGTAM